MEEKYRENFCFGEAHSRKIQRSLCVDFNKNKYEGALTQSAVKEQGTSQFGIQLIFGKWFIGQLRTPKNFEFWNSLELLEKVNCFVWKLSLADSLKCSSKLQKRDSSMWYPRNK